jgi:trehalose synthase
MNEVPLTALSPERFEALLPAAGYTRFSESLRIARERLDGRVLWHLNSTGQGGGVAEMLHSLLAYLAGADITVHGREPASRFAALRADWRPSP